MVLHLFSLAEVSKDSPSHRRGHRRGHYSVGYARYMYEAHVRLLCSFTAEKVEDPDPASQYPINPKSESTMIPILISLAVAIAFLWTWLYRYLAAMRGQFGTIPSFPSSLLFGNIINMGKIMGSVGIKHPGKNSRHLSVIPFGLSPTPRRRPFKPCLL